MQVTTNKMWINNLRKIKSKSGKEFYVFSTSLGQYNKGVKKGQYKGNLNLTYFDPKAVLANKMCLENVTFDLISEELEGKTYYKGIVLSFATTPAHTVQEVKPAPEKPQEELVNVDDYFSSMEDMAKQQVQPAGVKIIEEKPTLNNIINSYEQKKGGI